MTNPIYFAKIEFYILERYGKKANKRFFKVEIVTKILNSEVANRSETILLRCAKAAKLEYKNARKLITKNKIKIIKIEQIKKIGYETK